MNWGIYGVLIVFGLFVLLLIFNPRLSCFGKKIKSPLYPLFREKKKKKTEREEDYGFYLVNADEKQASKQEPGEERLKRKTENYEFYLIDDDRQKKPKKKKEKGKKKDVHSEFEVDSD